MSVTANSSGSRGVTVLRANTRGVIHISERLERPLSGNKAHAVTLYIWDSEGNMEAPDQLPRIRVLDGAGNEEVAFTNMTLSSVGVYTYSYSVAAGATLEQKRFEAEIVEGGVTRYIGASAYIIEQAIDVLSFKDTGTSTLNDANGSDTLVPTKTPTRCHISVDVSDIDTNLDDITLEVKIGAAASERIVASYRIKHDGANRTVDRGDGIDTTIAEEKIDIGPLKIGTSEQVVLDRTRNAGGDRDLVYHYGFE